MAPRKAAMFAAALVLAAGAVPAQDAPPPKRGGDLPWPAVARLVGERRNQGTSIDAISFSADDARILTRGGVREGGILIEWDAAAPTLLRRHAGSGDFVRLSLSPDGKRLAVVGENSRVKVLEANGGKEILSLEVPTDNLNWTPEDVAWSPAGDRLALCESDGSVMVWDGSTGSRLWRVAVFPSSGGHLAWSADGSVLAAGGGWRMEMNKARTVGWGRGALFVLDAKDGATLLTSTEGWKGRIEDVAFSPDGRLLAAAAGEGRDAAVLDWREKKEVLRLQQHPKSVEGVAWSPDGARLATGCRDGVVRLWNVPAATAAGTLEAPEGAGAVAWSRDGKRIASGGWGGVVWVFDALTGTRLSPGDGHAGIVNDLAWSPDGSRLATAGSDGTVRLWDGRTFRQLDVIRIREAGDEDEPDVHAVRWSPDGGRLAAGRSGGAVLLWDAAGKPAGRLDVEDRKDAWGEASAVLAWSPDGRRLAVGGSEPRARCWDPATGRIEQTLELTVDRIASLHWADGGNRLLAFGRSLGSYGTGWFEAFDPRTGKPLDPVPGGEGNVRAAASSIDGSLLATQEQDGTVRAWDAATMRCLWRRDGPWEGGDGIAFSPDGAFLATGTTKGHVVLLDAARGEKLLSFPAGEEGVPVVAWSPDGRFLATTSWKEAPTVWDLYPPVAASVAALPAGKDLGGMLAAAWNALGDPNVERGPAAEARMADLGPEAVEWIARRLTAAARDPESVPDLRALRGIRTLVRTGTPRAREVLSTTATAAPRSALARAAGEGLRALGPEKR